MKSRYLSHGLTFVGFALALFGQGCGGGDDDDSTGGSGVVSCDIVQGSVHYCEEAPGTTSGNTGCPTSSAGFTPGHGCSHDGVAATCKQGPYTFYLYGSSAESAALVQGICPNGTATGAGGTSGTGGTSGSGGSSGASGGTSGNPPAACEVSSEVVGSCLTSVGSDLYQCTEWTIDGSGLCAAGQSSTVTSTWVAGEPCPSDWTTCCQSTSEHVPVSCIYPANAFGKCDTGDRPCSL